MEFLARYQDGLVAHLRDVACVVDLAAVPVTLVILDAATRQAIDTWSAGDVRPRDGAPRELRFGVLGKPGGARIVVKGSDQIAAARRLLPALAKHQRQDTGRQMRIIALSTLALLSVIFSYIYGVPLIAAQLVGAVPPEWEIRLGDSAVTQIEAALTSGEGFVICEPDRNSFANQAIAGFVTEAFKGINSPFTPEVTVVQSEIPNAFALPGGRAYYLSALLDAAETPDEFAGVLAHELGHVYYRHAMESLISTSATGLLVGFVLGDMTGLSIAGAVGSALIDTRFSRDAERQADAFAAATAHRLGYSPSAFVDLIDRVARDDDFSRALALFSSHPLTEERRKALAAYDVPIANPKPAFTFSEWKAIKAMCPPLPAKPAT